MKLWKINYISNEFVGTKSQPLISFNLKALINSLKVCMWPLTLFILSFYLHYQYALSVQPLISCMMNLFDYDVILQDCKTFSHHNKYNIVFTKCETNGSSHALVGATFFTLLAIFFYLISHCIVTIFSRVMLISILRTLIKELKIGKEDNFYIGNNFFFQL